MQPFVDREYKYKLQLPTILLAMVCFGIAAIFLAYSAHSNDRGLIIHGLFRFSPRGATVFLWVLAGVCMGFVLFGASRIVIQRMILAQRVVLTAKAISVPKSRWSRQEIEIPYSTIVSVSEWKYGRRKSIDIVHGIGKNTISDLMLPSAAAYETIRELLAERIKALQTPAELREAIVWALSRAVCPACGESFTTSAADRAVSATESAVSHTGRMAAECLQEAGLRKDTPVQVHPFYPLECDTCQARWWYALVPRSFKPRTDARD